MYAASSSSSSQCPLLDSTISRYRKRPKEEEPEPPSDFYIKNIRLCSGLRGWDRATKRFWPTVTRQSLEEAWGFSLVTGSDMGSVTALFANDRLICKPGERGTWLKVVSVRDDSPVSRAGVRQQDFISRINGQIVYNLTAKDIDRIIRDSGTSLLLDIERDSSRALMFDGSTTGTVLSFLYEDYKYPYFQRRDIQRQPRWGLCSYY